MTAASKSIIMQQNERCGSWPSGAKLSALRPSQRRRTNCRDLHIGRDRQRTALIGRLRFFIVGDLCSSVECRILAGHCLMRSACLDPEATGRVVQRGQSKALPRALHQRPDSDDSRQCSYSAAISVEQNNFIDLPICSSGQSHQFISRSISISPSENRFRIGFAGFPPTTV